VLLLHAGAVVGVRGLSVPTPPPPPLEPPLLVAMLAPEPAAPPAPRPAPPRPSEPTPPPRSKTPAVRPHPAVASPAPAPTPLSPAPAPAIPDPAAASPAAPAPAPSAPVAPPRPAQPPHQVAVSCRVPPYPAGPRRRGESGVVLLKLLIDEHGAVIDRAIERSSGSPELDEAALDALSRCRFLPGSVDGQPQTAWARLRYVWTLDR